MNKKKKEKNNQNNKNKNKTKRKKSLVKVDIFHRLILFELFSFFFAQMKLCWFTCNWRIFADTHLEFSALMTQ